MKNQGIQYKLKIKKSGLKWSYTYMKTCLFWASFIINFWWSFLLFEFIDENKHIVSVHKYINYFSSISFTAD